MTICNAEAHLLSEGIVWEGPKKSLCVMYSNCSLERHRAKESDCQVGAVLLLRHSKWIEILKSTAVLDFQK